MKNLLKLMSSLLLMAAFATATVSCSKDDNEQVSATGITVEPATFTIHTGDKHTLSAIVLPENTQDRTVTWSSSAANIVAVDANTGEITGIAIGSAIITAATVNGKTATSSVSVIPSVYAAGTDTDGNNKLVAVLWKNGVASKLESDEYISGASSVFVTDNNDVYIAGKMSTDASDKAIVTVWKNGVIHQKWTDGTKEVEVRSIAVSGNNIYVAGAEKNEAGFFEAVLWENGVKKRLTQGIDEDAYAYSVFASGNDVYVTGGEYFRFYNSRKYAAVLWKNGVKQILADTSIYHSEAHSVFVSGNDVYAAGQISSRIPDLNEWGLATVWKNGEMQKLTNAIDNTAIARSVFVLGNDVYVAGEEFFPDGTSGANVATLWKNGVKQSLDNISNETIAFTVFAFGNDVYVGGVQDDEEPGEDTEDKLRAILWTNGEKQQLSDKKSIVTSVFVK
ncbi:MAG: Ig-like domain-containing protein [Prevotellaceae bacterium]|jgi:sulfur transfer complex TusBCD TusB component (DsrH family)|nr:Ig-like domain-containing protein [Prevotellaceae bacterium]